VLPLRDKVDLIRVSSETELSELVGRIIAGDSAAEEELVRRYSKGVAIIIDQVVRNRSVAEDLSQDTFRIVLEKVRREELREPERLSGFVCSTARNNAIAHIRRTRRLEAIGEAEHIPDPAPSQLDEVLREEKAKAVRQMITELKQRRDRELIFRYYIAEEDKETICRDLGLTRAQFNNVISRATSRFKEIYERKNREP